MASILAGVLMDYFEDPDTGPTRREQEMIDTITSLRAELAAERAKLAAEKEARQEVEAELAAERVARDKCAEEWVDENERRQAAEAELAAEREARQKAEARAEACYATHNVGASDRLLAIEREARALVLSLPTCDECSKPATRAFRRGSGRWCDEHDDGWGQAPEYPRAAPLRALVALLEAK